MPISKFWAWGNEQRLETPKWEKIGFRDYVPRPEVFWFRPFVRSFSAWPRNSELSKQTAKGSLCHRSGNLHPSGSISRLCLRLIASESRMLLVGQPRRTWQIASKRPERANPSKNSFAALWVLTIATSPLAIHILFLVSYIRFTRLKPCPNTFVYLTGFKTLK